MRFDTGKPNGYKTNQDAAAILIGCGSIDERIDEVARRATHEPLDALHLLRTILYISMESAEIRRLAERIERRSGRKRD